MSMKIFSLLFPFYQLHNSTQEINKKIEKLMKSPETYNFEYASINPAIKKDVLKETLNSVLSNKREQSKVEPNCDNNFFRSNF